MQCETDKTSSICHRSLKLMRIKCVPILMIKIMSQSIRVVGMRDLHWVALQLPLTVDNTVRLHVAYENARNFAIAGNVSFQQLIENAPKEFRT